MEYLIKVDILNKISKLVKLYSLKNCVDRYLIKTVLVDKYENKYNILSLNEEKLFLHSKHFKLKKNLLINSSGNKNKYYYIEFERYILLEHKLYKNIMDFAYKLIVESEKFNKNDLIELNKIYRKILEQEKKIKK